MKFIEAIKIAYWFIRRPNVFESYITLYFARQEYNRKRRAHKKFRQEQRAFHLATAKFNAELRRK